MKRTILAAHPLFAGLEPRVLDRLVGYATLQSLPRGEVVFEEGEPGTALLAVVAGGVRIAAQTSEGKEIVLNVVWPGEVFGEVALLDGGPRTGTATTIAPTTLLRLERRDLLPVLREHGEVGLHFIAVLCARLRRTSRQVTEVLFDTTEHRLARAVLSLAGQGREADGPGSHGWGGEGPSPADGHPARVSATQKELGQMIGLSRESTNKLLQRWAAEGIVGLEKGALRVTDRAALAALAGDGP